MDFNPLDLLASAALRDNRTTTQPDNTSTDLKLQQQDDADGEEEDGETDDKSTGPRGTITNGDVMPCSGCDLEDNTTMGSMKSGKDKRSLGKPVTVIPGDSVFADKKTHAVDKNPLSSSSLVTEHVDKDLEKARTLESETVSVEERVLGGETCGLCNGDEKHSAMVHEHDSKLCNGKVPPVFDSANTAGFPASHGDCCEDCIEKSSVTEVERNVSQTNQMVSGEVGEKISDFSQGDNESIAEKHVSVTSDQDQIVSVSPSHSSEAHAPVGQDMHGGLSPECDCVKDNNSSVDQDMQMTAGVCSNCDENGTLSLTLVPAVGVDTDSVEKTLDTHDQKSCDFSGIKEFHPSSDSKEKNSPSSVFQPSTLMSVSSVVLDHSYAASPGKPIHRPSTDTPEDSGDAFESADENGSADDIEHRPRSLSVDSDYLHYGIPGTPHEREHNPSADKASLMSPTPSVDSVSNDSSVSENSNTLGQFYSILVPGCQNQALYSPCSSQKLAVVDSLGTVLDQLSGEGARFYLPSPLDGTACPGPAPKCGKFRIGTFASFSSSNLELDREVAAAIEMKERRLKIGIPSEPGMKYSMSSPALASPGSPFPLLQSPGIEWDRSDAGSEIQDDLDSSNTEDKCLSSSYGSDISGITTLVWNHPVFHDHDYCCKETSERLFGKPVAEVRPMKIGKRKYIKKKDREIDEEKIRKKGKYLKRELLKQDNRFSLPSSFETKLMSLKNSVQSESVGTRPVGRPRKRLDSRPSVESDIDPETGAKMKITGKFQDQYVYYLSKTSRSRRRKLPDGAGTHPADRIILPAPKPGDIVVPHLTDADIEAIRHGGRAALKRNGSTGYPSHMSVPQQDHVDMDINIVNTILSMENDNLGSPLPAQPSDISDPIGLYEEHPVADGLGFMGENMNLTPDQVDLLLSVVKDVEVPSYNPLDTGDSKLATSQALDFLSSADTGHMGSPALPSMAATTVDKDMLGSAISPSNIQGSSGILNSAVNPPVDIKPDVVKHEAKMLPDTQSTAYNGDMVLASFDKTLEFLKGDFKPDFFQESPISVPQNVENVVVSATPENDTPWIVTVTIYWNDIPAIIISNQPYVRLVDIHKQILPAKDTGILKKRCQLMNIPVLNCSDMQRYFLVQYGRAYNSKSTLVISKDQARELIGYYVDPQPRGMRSDDGGSGAGLKRSSSCVELGSYSDSSVHLHPPPFASPRRRGGFRRRATPSQSQSSSPGPGSPVQAIVEPRPLAAPAAVLDSPTKRLRHKKINFLEMLRGEDSASSSPATPSAESCRSEESLGDSYYPDHSPTRGSSKATNGHKRRRSKEVSPELGTGRRNSRVGGSKERKRSTEGKTVSPKGADSRRASHNTATDVSKDADVRVLVDTQSDVKAKKRSPGLVSAVSVPPSSRAKASKFGPLKVKLKGLLNFGTSKAKQSKKKNLFGRKGPVSIQTGASRTLRVLKVAHQDANADIQEEEVTSQVAEVHLDLYKRRMSPCVKCWTCEKFLSVPGFLQHQHLDSSSQALVDVKQLQVLVPMNKENISMEEKRLWNEFVGLQKRLDRSPVTACSMTPRQPLLPPFKAAGAIVHIASAGDDATVAETSTRDSSEQDRLLYNSEAEMVNVESHTSDSNCINVTSPADCEAGSDVAVDVQTDESAIAREPYAGSSQPPLCPSPARNPAPAPPRSPTLSTTPKHRAHEEKLMDGISVVKRMHGNPSRPQQRQHHKATAQLNVRTSTRKRKKKQFFSIENYSFSRKSAKLDVDHRDAGGDVTAESEDSESGIPTLSNGPQIASYAVMESGN